MSQTPKEFPPEQVKIGTLESRLASTKGKRPEELIAQWEENGKHLPPEKEPGPLEAWRARRAAASQNSTPTDSIED